jgi:hypothetical protein
MHKLSWLLGVLVLSVASPQALAVRVHSIYQDEIPVANQSQPTRIAAEQGALADVFVKVSGNSHVLDTNPNLKANLAHAETYVQEFSYTQQKNAAKASRYLLFVRFDSDAVNKLLSEAGTTVWGQSRPLILVWLALQGPNHPADIIDSSTEIPLQLKQSAKSRGLPMIFPVMDVTDLSLVSVNDITSKATPSLQQASARYASNAILIGSLVEHKADDYSSHWQLMLDKDKWTWDVTGKSMQDMFTVIVDNVTDTLAAKYGMVMTTAIQSELTMNVIGVKQQAQLLQLMKYVQRQNSVADVQLKNITNDEVTLNVSLRGTHDAFVQALALNKNLQATTATTPADGTLEYRWLQ